MGHYIDEFTEQAVLNRWFKGQLSDLERNFARGWRDALNRLDPDTTIEWVKNFVPTDRKFSAIEDVKAFTHECVKSSGLEGLHFALLLLGIHSNLVFPIQKRYIAAGQPSLDKFAPYAASALKVDIFSYLCLRSSFISKDRASNKVDIAYLYYLPFCHAFVSKDRRLQKRVAHVCMGNGQWFGLILEKMLVANCQTECRFHLWSVRSMHNFCIRHQHLFVYAAPPVMAIRRALQALEP